MIRVGLVGLGKMGLSHLAMIRPHPDVDVAGICDSTGYMLDVLSKYTGVPTYSSYDEMLDKADLDAVIISTPSFLHADMVRKALDHRINVFCEKPLFLDPNDGAELTARAEELGLVTQVGYHNKFVGTFREVKRLVDAGAIGTVTNVLAEAYGPVVLKPQGVSWRSRRSSGGGCLYDYAAHPLDLVTWYFGKPDYVSGSALASIFSREIDDAAFSTLHYPEGHTVQLSTNWSDESQRKMTTRITIWGTGGRIYADRQELHLYLRDSQPVPDGYRAGWTVKYTTELTEPTWFYLRGEEYSAQLDTFVKRVAAKQTDGVNTFASASVTDEVIAMINQDARSERATTQDGDYRPAARRRRLAAPRRRSATERLGAAARSVRTGVANLRSSRRKPR